MAPLSIEMNTDAHQTLKLVSEWGERQKKLRAMVPYLSAEGLLVKVKELLPTKDEYRVYRNGLRLAQVMGTPGSEPVFAIMVSPKARRIRRVDVPRTVLYIRPRRRMRPPLPEIEILEKFNPWTLESMPFVPNRKDALVVSRKVSEREVQRVSQSRRADRSQWRKELVKCGIRDDRLNRRLLRTEVRRLRAIPDVEFEALRMEFGLGGTKPVPHWRPAIRRFLPGGLSSMIRHGGLVQALADPGFTEWRSWPPSVLFRVTLDRARRFRPFQRALNVRV